jgi:hypothetical protein
MRKIHLGVADGALHQALNQVLATHQAFRRVLDVFQVEHNRQHTTARHVGRLELAALFGRRPR